MFNPGCIVFQKNTLVNKNNYKDNKMNRLSVVLFEFKYNNEEYVCSCPITNHKQTIKNISKNSLYIPFQILSDQKYCSVKLDSVYFYPKKDITKTGLNLEEKTVLKIYNALLDLEINKFALSLEQCFILKENIKSIIINLEKNEKNRIKEEKRLKKLKRKELKKNYNIKKN